MSVPLPKDPLQALEICLSQVPHYHNAQRLQQDITFLFTQMRSALKPQVREFVSPTGDQVKLFFLGGTIPISYRNTRYNIPLTIYFDPPYPAQPPRCFVTPTNDMKIKDRHQHVDRTGMVYLPYLHSWNAYGSTITDLVGHMQQVFSEVPPVVATAKPQGQGLNNQMDITLGGGSYPSSETSQTGMSTQYGAGMNKNIWSGTESAAPKAPNASSHHSFSGYSQNTTMPSGMFANMQSTPSMSSTPQMQPGSVSGNGSAASCTRWSRRRAIIRALNTSYNSAKCASF
ncbi:unnamed protein product [Amoebophrya sp. A25]|nr:unnamed protein product [Amoebophrya sp. A25]|eukprot:GSA25T00013632001.1